MCLKRSGHQGFMRAPEVVGKGNDKNLREREKSNTRTDPLETLTASTRKNSNTAVLTRHTAHGDRKQASAHLQCALREQDVPPSAGHIPLKVPPLSLGFR